MTWSVERGTRLSATHDDQESGGPLGASDHAELGQARNVRRSNRSRLHRCKSAHTTTRATRGMAPPRGGGRWSEPARRELGDASSPIGCNSTTTQQTFTTAVPEVATSDIANDLRVRVFAQPRIANL